MNSPTPIRIALCADDYGLNESIDSGILSLLSMRRLTTVSCMTTSPTWLSMSAPRLLELNHSAEIGMHLNWTEPFLQQPFMPLKNLLLKSYVASLNAQEVQRIIHTQLDAFEKTMNSRPDFIDGHQHIHQLPHIRQTLIQIIQSRYPHAALWVRNTVPPMPCTHFKALVLASLGGYSLKRDLSRHAIQTNADFLGVYGFDEPNYGQRFATWLKQAQTGSLIMCHPSMGIDDSDSIARQRFVEYTFFASDNFNHMLAAHHVQLQPLNQTIQLNRS